MKRVKPTGGRYQTVTKVKVLSLEITEVKEADSLPKLEGNMCGIDMVRYYRSFGIWGHGMILRRLQELGIPCKLRDSGETRNLPLATVNTHSVTGGTGRMAQAQLNG